MEDIKFVDGLRVFKPFDTAPEFVKGTLVMNRDEMIEWLKGQSPEIKVDIKESKKGTWYCAVNTYKNIKSAQKEEVPTIDLDAGDEIKIEDVPF